MKTIAAYTCLICLTGLNVGTAEETDFTLTVSGELAEKLPEDTRLYFWNPSTKTKAATLPLGESPLKLPCEHFRGHQWHVVFYRPKGDLMFSVTLSEDLFDEPRAIEVLLNQPEPHIRPMFSFGGEAMYFAGITKRMRYRDLPVWDRVNDTFGKPVPPEMEVTRKSDGKVIHKAAMEDGCMATRWWAVLNRGIQLEHGETYRFSVHYDSRGLFPEKDTVTDFTYNENEHYR